MLLKLRGGLDSLFVTILLGLLIVAFAIWGIGPSVFNSSNQTVAVVGDEEVPAQQYFNAVQQRAQQMQAQFGGQIDSNQIIHGFGIGRQVLNELVTAAALDDAAAKLGMRASDNDVAKQLAQIEAFQMPDGSISQEMVQQQLVSMGLTEQELYDDIRRSITRVQLLQSLIGATPISDQLVEQLHIFQAERRRADMIAVKASEIVDIANPDEETLATYYEANKGAYMTPPRRSYQYLLFTPAQFADRAEFTEDDLRLAYDIRADEYISPETRLVDQVTFLDESAATAFIEAVNSGADFVTEATSRTEYAADELSIGNVSREGLELDYDVDTAEAVFALENGAVAGPIEGLAGYNVFRVNAITEGTERTFDEVRPELEVAVRNEKAIDLMFDFLPELEDALAEEGTLPAVAEKLNLELATVSAVDNQGRNVDGTQIITQEIEGTLLNAAFTLDSGMEPELTDIDPSDNQKGSYLIEVSEVLDPVEQALEDVRSQVQSAWITDQRQLRAGEIADAALARIVAGEDLEEVAADIGSVSLAANNVLRTASANSELSDNIRRLIFSLGDGQADIERSSDGDGYVIVRVNEIVPGDPETQQTQVAALKTRLEQEQQNTLMMQFQNYLLTQNPPEVNGPLIDQLFPRDQVIDQ